MDVLRILAFSAVFAAASATECAKNEYVGLLGLACDPCTRCPVGHGVAVNCSKYNDTVCKPCEKGYESLQTDFSACTLMPRIIHVKPDSKFPLKYTVTVIVVLAALITLVIVVAILIRQRCKNKHRSLDREPEPVLLAEYNRDQDKVILSDGAHNYNSSGYSSLSSVVIDQSLRVPVDLHQFKEIPNGNEKLSRLPHMAFEELGFLLNPEHAGKDWEAVAGELGYSTLHIANFKLSRNTRFFQTMLFSLMTGRGSTIGRLHQALCHLGRSDCVELLRRYSTRLVDDGSDEMLTTGQEA